MKNMSILLILGALLVAGCASPSSAPASDTAAPGKAFTSFAFESPAAEGVITASAIAVTVPFDTSVSWLAATFEVSEGASVTIAGVEQVSGVTYNDFSEPVTYTVTASDESTHDYVVTVTEAPSSANNMTEFGFVDPEVTGVITANAVAVTVPSGTDVTELVATFTTMGASVKVGDEEQTSGVTPNDFSSPVVYSVVAANGDVQDYTVTVTIDTTPTFTVTYDANGGTGTAPAESAGHHEGDEVTTASGASLSLTDFKFGGWTDSLTGPGTTTASGSTLTMPDADVTLYAIWIPKAFNYSASGHSLRLTSFSSTTLGAVVIPQGVTELAAVGSSSSYVSSVSIPASLVTIAAGAFSGASKLTAFTVATNNPEWTADANGVVLSKDGTKLLVAPGKISGSYTIPSGVTSVMDEAFVSCTSLTGVTIPSTVTSIGYQSFANTGLLAVSLPASVTSLGSLAFSSSALQTYTVAAENPSFSSDSAHALLNKDQTTLIAIGVQSVVSNTYTMPSTVTTIGANAFSSMGILKTITLPSGLTTIGSMAFALSGLTSITIPAGVTSIGNSAFYYATKLTSVTMLGSSPPTLSQFSSAFDNTTLLTAIHVPSGALNAYMAATGWSTYSSLIVTP